jgi:hypothetical protein
MPAALSSPWQAPQRAVKIGWMLAAYVGGLAGVGAAVTAGAGVGVGR